MTLPEAIVGLFVVISLIGILLALYMPAITAGPVKGRMTQTLSNMKQLHLATQTMSLDNETTSESPIRWTCTGTTPLTFQQWSNALVPSYLNESDFKKLFAATEERAFWFERRFTNAITVFAVSENDRADTLLLATKNWQGIGNPNLDDSQYAKSGFIVFRKGGDGAILLKNQAASTNLIGSGGMHNYLPLR